MYSPKRKLPFTQTGGRSNPQVISEFLTVVTLKLHSVPPINDKRQLMNGLYNVPAGSRLLRTEANKGVLHVSSESIDRCSNSLNAQDSCGTPLIN